MGGVSSKDCECFFALSKAASVFWIVKDDDTDSIILEEDDIEPIELHSKKTAQRSVSDAINFNLQSKEPSNQNSPSQKYEPLMSLDKKNFSRLKYEEV